MLGLRLDLTDVLGGDRNASITATEVKSKAHGVWAGWKGAGSQTEWAERTEKEVEDVVTRKANE